jgi:broad specificity phosphatase PhoE
MSTRLILIRHGETDWSIKKRYCSFVDIDINDKGKRQAEKLYRRLHKEEIHKVYSSDNKRTLNFARIAFKGFPIEKVPQLREMNFGIFEGLTYREIIKRYPKIYTRWLKKPFNIDIPDGESLSDFKKRVNRILKKIVSSNRNKTLVIVTHAGPIKIIISDILKSKDIWKINIDLASLNIIEFMPNVVTQKKLLRDTEASLQRQAAFGERKKAKILLLNDTSYLDG